MTLPDGAELGATTDPKALIKGEPSKVSATATALSDESTRVGGLADTFDAVTVEGWQGGVGAPAYTAKRSAESDKWAVYADLLGKAGSALSTYSGALTTAQSRAADAIAKWEEGEEATATAVRQHNDAVEAYNAYVSRPVRVPTYGGGAPPSIGPARPGPFVDPGAPLREEAQQILDDAREALDAAGATAVKALGGLEGAKTEGSTSGPSASGSAEGPSFSWDGFENTFGKDPTKGPDGKDPDGEGGEDSPFKIDFGSVEGKAHVWGAEGSWEDYYGDVKVDADGSVTVLGAEASAGGSISKDGLSASAEAKAVLAGAEGSVGAEYGPAAVGASGNAFVGASAEGEAEIGKEGVHAGGEVFAGAKAGVSAEGDVGGVGGEVGAEGWAGIGASGDVDFGVDDGKLTIGGSGGLAFGLGGKVSGSVTLDFDKMADTGTDIIEGIGGLLS